MKKDKNIELVIVDITKENLDINDLYNNLPNEIKKKVDKYHIEEKRNLSIIGWSIVNNRLNFMKNEVLENEFGKPYTKNKYFSISHSNNLVGVLFSEYECGLDIEQVSLRSIKLATKILTDEELKEYEKNPDILIAKWTKIEAYCKGIGTGFRFSLVKELPKDINTNKIFDNQKNEYYYSIWVNKKD